ncbi:MAG: hypothetical protein H6839_17320 [Planctomycetes bacterium]|nr:hypothetical protein [Planctomycetota bacterium]
MAEGIQNLKSKIQNQLRSLHRDFGFFAVGLTFIYALSGLAVNHINDWDPSFSHFKRLVTIETPLPEDEAAAVSEALAAIDVDATPLEVITTRQTLTRYEIEVPGKHVMVHPDANEIIVETDGEPEKKVFELGDSLPDDDWRAAVTALHRIGIADEPTRVEKVTFPVRDIDITFEGRNIRVQDYKTGYDIFDEGQKPRPFLRVFNWLHLNRGKAGWTWIADAYAVVLLFLATSGMLMVRGRKGLIGRGGVFLLLGVAVPVIYLIVSGGP